MRVVTIFFHDIDYRAFNTFDLAGTSILHDAFREDDISLQYFADALLVIFDMAYVGIRPDYSFRGCRILDENLPSIAYTYFSAAFPRAFSLSARCRRLPSLLCLRLLPRQDGGRTPRRGISFFGATKRRALSRQ